MTAYQLQIIPEATDIDILGHVNNAVWVRWIQDIAVAHWETIAQAEDRDKFIWVVTRHEIDYRANVGAGQIVTAQTWVPDPPRGARFNRFVRFTDPDGRVLVEAKSSWALIERASGRLKRISNEMAAPFMSQAPD